MAILGTSDMRSTYDMVFVVVGHGPATAHDLAAIQGSTDAAVIEAARIWAGNTVRTMTITRFDDLLNSSFRPRKGRDSGCKKE